MEIEKLRSDLRDLLVQDPEATFAKLKSLLPAVSGRHKDLLLLETRWESLEREVTKGVIAPAEADLKRNRIVEGLLDTIGDLTDGDFRPGAGAKKATTSLPRWLWPAVGGMAALALTAALLFSPKKEGKHMNGDVSPTLPTGDAEVFQDPRDGQRYRTVRLAGRTWLADNLRYDAPNSVCYADDTLHCAELGRLYFWKDALTACPTGWHLPSAAEWKDLALNAGGYQLNVKTPPEVVGNPAQALAALSLGGNSGFDAAAGGYWNAHNYDGLEKFGGYWSSSKAYQDYVMAAVFDTWRERQLILEGEEQGWMLSCRCVKN